ncbi:MAG TPA: YbaB/EbfC family nucleoid-associated protein [Thermotogota bacterium]|nr:YbaB/EbfC family nucleoid-associated protein [Thermotogota bacterium]NLH18810.1 YbaB/EbfC family nucleoid-associated protein [Thermotogaceae bacterium]OQC32578.1 MAG: Nucleoid-associated protein YbaB [Thermotogota bacterium ADurb.Bin062]HNW45929.1 YbaB/EbfC family nucleoid-associated protein [Thermotogota bacterium]HNY82320.1 YbaB/EbfC family nucleoid-associated protein [Thermotogota bacterium]
MAKKMRSFGGKSLRPSSTSGKPSMQDLMTKINQAGETMQEIEESFAQKSFEITAGGGAIKITMKGDFHISAIELEDGLLEEKEELTDLLSAAFNQAIETVSKEKDAELEQLKTQLGIGGLGI